MEGLQKLEGQLSGSQPKDVDMDLLNSLLGAQAQEDYEGVMRLESSLRTAANVVDKGDHFELTRAASGASARSRCGTSTSSSAATPPAATRSPDSVPRRSCPSRASRTSPATAET